MDMLLRLFSRLSPCLRVPILLVDKPPYYQAVRLDGPMRPLVVLVPFEQPFKWS